MSRFARDQSLWGAAPEALTRSEEAKRRIARVTATWGALALGSIVMMTVLIIWHLIRRGRLIREGLQPPREVGLVELQPPDPLRGAEGG
jgi:hypothetical protein